MKTPEELLRELAHNPAELLEYAAGLQRQLAEAQQELALKGHSLVQAERNWHRPRSNSRSRRSNWPKPRRSLPI